MGQFKVNCNAVAFGTVATRLTRPKTDDNVISIEGESVQLGVPAEMIEAGRAYIPLGIEVTVAQAAGGIFFLCSPWSDYVHGQVLNVTGGLTIGMTA
jgi:3-oxoacyl-[acyl-carrier protein] reductase